MTDTITATVNEIQVHLDLTGAPDLDGVIPNGVTIDYQPDWHPNAAYVTVRGTRRLKTGKPGGPTLTSVCVGDLDDGSEQRIDCPMWLADLVETHRPASCK